ncbi:hypothetical protein [Sphingobium sp.]|uniref:hypothetical protein n=1 Tax=Sphingobium sp. TaxID=1912891 RepID=UPI0025F2664F|nr:hypothetical protein [Sphingobium sp.]
MAHKPNSPVNDARPPIRWTDLASWHPQLTSALSDVLRPGAVDRLSAVESSELYDDDSEWLELVLGEFSGNEKAFLELVDQALEWSRVRTFHGTRTADARSFTHEGIRLHDRPKLEAEVRSLVAREPTLHGMADRLDEAFARTAHLIDHGRCFVVVDERVLIEECGHYLLGGSEFVQGILGPQAARSVLSDCAPTVIEVDLPLSRVPPSQLREFSRTLVGEWAKILRRPRAEPRYLDFSFCLQEPIPAAWVAGHFHPLAVHDPHEGRRSVPTRQADCAACAHASSDA